MKHDFTAIILAGGKSSRIGSDKALLKINGITIIEHIVDTLSQLLKDIKIITNNPSNYSFLNFDLHKDILPGFGPLSGIHAGLFYSKTEKNIFLTCDMPFLSIKLLEGLIDSKYNSPVTLLKYNGRVQPFPGIYTGKIFKETDRLLLKAASFNQSPRSKKLKGASMNNLIEAVETHVIEADEFTDPGEYDFFNINSPEDYISAKEIYKKLTAI
jgi:molybdopterin-guanine dinucleotide biosynthesis protein A